MKLKKLVIAILLIAIVVAQFGGFVLAAEEPTSVDIVMNTGMGTDLTQLCRNDEFDVSVRMENLINVGKGIMAMGATLTYNDEILELKEIIGADRWGIDYNEKSGKLIAVREKESATAPADTVYVKAESTIMLITFKVKADAAESSNGIIGLSDITLSGGNGIINATNVSKSFKVVKKSKRITSTEYYVNDTEKNITKIVPGTTVAEFKNNINAENILDSELVFTKNTTTLTNESVLTTGTILTVADTDIRYTIIVKGDIDGEITNGKLITENDLAKIKLHYIETDNAELTGISLKAADYDLDGKITVNDIAMIKLIILDVPNLEM